MLLVPPKMVSKAIVCHVIEYQNSVLGKMYSITCCWQWRKKARAITGNARGLLCFLSGSRKNAILLVYRYIKSLHATDHITTFNHWFILTFELANMTQLNDVSNFHLNSDQLVSCSGFTLSFCPVAAPLGGSEGPCPLIECLTPSGRPVGTSILTTPYLATNSWPPCLEVSTPTTPPTFQILEPPLLSKYCKRFPYGNGMKEF